MRKYSTERMHCDAMQVVLLSGKTAEYDRASFFIFVLVRNRRPFRCERERMGVVISYFKLLLESHCFESCGSPAYSKLFLRNQLCFADSQQSVPAEARNFSLSVPLLVHPAGARFHEKVPSGGDIIF